MKKYLAQLRPMERRLLVGVMVVVVLVLNAVYIWPHFGDWNNLKGRLNKAKSDLARNQKAVAQIPELQKQVNTYSSAGETVPVEDQAINLMRSIQAQAAQCGFGIQNFSRAMMRTNDAFFVEQIQNINVVATEAQLVDFLYKIGSGASMTRVRDLELQPDAPRQRLNANIRLVASYQKNPAGASAKTSTAKAK